MRAAPGPIDAAAAPPDAPALQSTVAAGVPERDHHDPHDVRRCEDVECRAAPCPRCVRRLAANHSTAPVTAAAAPHLIAVATC